MMYSATAMAALGLAAVAEAHMLMNTPARFADITQNGPLDASAGRPFPCHGSKYETPAATNMAIGSTQPLAFTGSAVHGGGSCQISVTYDKKPTASSVWKVIHSIEGGCPAQGVAGNLPENANGNGATKYTFKIPDLPTGDAVLAWTWFNKIGNREMYMNCAPVTIGAGSAKRDEDELLARNITALAELVKRDQASFNALPDMFVANVKGVSTCETVEGTDLVFPNPGKSVTSMGTNAYGGPKSGCNVASAQPAATGGAGGASPVQTSAPAATSKAGNGASSAGASPPKSTLAGGVFATVAPPAASSAPAVSAPSSPAAPASPAVSKASSASTPAATGAAGSAGAQAVGSPCTTEGMWNCIGGSSFQQCGSGTWSAVTQMAAGTTCTPGQSSTFSMAAVKQKRSVRFSHAHLQRHIAHS